jgi:hypothetical protein
MMLDSWSELTVLKNEHDLYLYLSLKSELHNGSIYQYILQQAFDLLIYQKILVYILMEKQNDFST